jgi:AcrR family transcriptional regulator
VGAVERSVNETVPSGRREEGAMKRADRSQLRRREMLAAYYETLVAEGLQGSSIAKIARRLDVPPSLLIHYFGTKEQMTIELVDYLLEEYREGYGDRLAAITDPLERLQAIVVTFFSPRYHELLDDSVFYACFYLSLRHPSVRRSYHTLFETTLQLIEGAVRDGIEAGVVRRDDPHELALVIKALEEGYAFLIGGEPDEAVREETGVLLQRRVFALLGLSQHPSIRLDSRGGT